MPPASATTTINASATLIAVPDPPEDCGAAFIIAADGAIAFTGCGALGRLGMDVAPGASNMSTIAGCGAGAADGAIDFGADIGIGAGLIGRGGAAGALGIGGFGIPEGATGAGGFGGIEGGVVGFASSNIWVVVSAQVVSGKSTYALTYLPLTT